MDLKFKMHIIHVTLGVMGHSHWVLMVPVVLTPGGGPSSKVDETKVCLKQVDAWIETAVTSVQQYLMRKHLLCFGIGAVKALNNGIRRWIAGYQL